MKYNEENEESQTGAMAKKILREESEENKHKLAGRTMKHYEAKAAKYMKASQRLAKEELS